MGIVRAYWTHASCQVLEVELTSGRDIVIGRNDYQQNARQNKTETNIKTAEVKFQTVSISPAGFVSAADLVVSADPVFYKH
jgi:hypothetical protein